MSQPKGNKVVKYAVCGGCLIVMGGFGFFILSITLFAVHTAAAHMPGIGKDLETLSKLKQAGPHQQETYAFKEDTSHLDPFAVLDEVREKVGGKAHLYSIEAEFVGSDGTMNLNATYNPGPKIKYKFYGESEPGSGEVPPIGAGRSAGDVWYKRTQVECYLPGEDRHIVLPSGRHNSSYTYTNLGMDFERGSPTMGRLDEEIGNPTVTTQDLWKIALQKGAPKDAVATIRYSKTGYHFQISGAGIDFVVDKTGKLKS